MSFLFLDLVSADRIQIRWWCRAIEHKKIPPSRSLNSPMNEDKSERNCHTSR